MSGVRFLRRLRADQDGEAAAFAGASGRGGTAFFCFTGRDGADGLLRMRKAGAYTIGQDKDSCVVYGMPMVAYDIGAVTIQASCENIASVLMTHLRTGK